MESIDKTGQPPTDQDLDEAIDEIKRQIVKMDMSLPPKLLIQLPNIHRCLKDLVLTRRAKK